MVRAPEKGKVVALSLRPGQRVANLPLRSWIAFVDHGYRRLAVGIPQSRLRYVKTGQEAEIVLRLLPNAPMPTDPALPYAVILELDDESIDLLDIPGGAVGTAAIYTDSVGATHIIRKVMMRMEAWMNYIIP